MSKEMVMKYLPPANAEGAIRIFVCGPPGMMKHLSGEKKSPADQGDLTGLLADMRYTKEQVYKY
ncbi:hypothetical protein EON67_08755 [archaeon]|nr:MAG: hypothetical protein EON67_08755 [archaeon]